MRASFRLFAALPVLASSPALATEPAGANAPVSVQVQHPVAASPDNASGGGFVAPSFQILADVKGGTTAQLTIAGARDNASSFGQTTYGLTLSAPINKTTGAGSLITQRGIPTGFGAAVSVSSIIGRNPDFTTPEGPATGQVRDWLLMTNLNASIGIEDFKFRSPVTFTRDERRRTSHAASASLGLLTASNRTFIAGGFEYRRRYKAPDEQIFCPAPVGPGPTECTQGVFAPPTRQTEFNLFVVGRTLFRFGQGMPIAAEIRATYDANNDVFGVEAPIYFFQDGNGGLRGGFRIGWDSEHDDVRGSVFIGVPFDLIRL
jgi:hypothetical protein